MLVGVRRRALDMKGSGENWIMRATSLRPRFDADHRFEEAITGLTPPAAGARNTPASGYCKKCSKIAWASREKAEREVHRIKAIPDARKPHLMDAYPCPFSAAKPG